MPGDEPLVSLSRLPGLRPDQPDEAQAAVSEAIAGGDRAEDASFPLTEADGSLVGPFNALLYCPAIGDAVQRLGAAVRFRSRLPAAVREIAILNVARRLRCDFEWWAHAPIARRAGLSDAQLAALKSGDGAEFGDRAQQAAHDLSLTLLRDGSVPDGLYRAAVEELGEPGVCELLILVGYYTLLAQMMNALQVGVPPGETAVFPADTPTAHTSTADAPTADAGWSDAGWSDAG